MISNSHGSGSEAKPRTRLDYRLASTLPTYRPSLAIRDQQEGLFGTLIGFEMNGVDRGNPSIHQIYQ